MSTWDSAVADAPIVAVIRHRDAAIAERIALAAAEGGIEIVEVTFTVPGAPLVIERLRDALPRCVIGAGTVLTEADAREAADAGAAFLVSPVVDTSLIEWAGERDVRFIPGAATPSEIALAHRSGADTVKVFPASALGTAFVAAVRDVLPNVSLMPTGGIRPADAGAWLEAGALAVGLAGAITSAWSDGGEASVAAVARAALSASTNSRRPS